MAFPLFSVNNAVQATALTLYAVGLLLLLITNKLPLGLPGVAQKFNFGPTIKLEGNAPTFSDTRTTGRGN